MKMEQVLFKRGAEKNDLLSSLRTGRSQTHCQQGEMKELELIQGGISAPNRNGPQGSARLGMEPG